MCCCAICMACETACCCVKCACKEGKVKRGANVLHVALFFLTVAVAIVVRIWGSDLFFDFYAFKVGCEGEFRDRCLGTQGVYRCSFASVAFFLTLSLLVKLFPVFHRSRWAFKIVAYLSALIGSFFIPNEFFDVYSTVARVASVFFLLLQIIILVDFAHDWHESWTERADALDEAEGLEPSVCGNKWRLLYFLCALGMFFGSLGANIFMIIFFKTCSATTMLIASCMVCGIGLTVLSVMEKVGRGALSPAVVFMYSTFLTYSSLSSNPDEDCNPLYGSSDPTSLLIGAVLAGFSLSWTSFRAASSGYNVFRADEADDEEEDRKDLEAVLTGEDDAENPRPKIKRKKAKDDDDDEDRYQHQWFFHLIMALGGFYMAMLLTDWGTNGGEIVSSNISIGHQSMWIKMGTMWLACAVFLWTLIAPICCPNRNFDDNHNSFDD